VSAELPGTLNDAMTTLSKKGIHSIADLLSKVSSLSKHYRVIGTWALGQFRDKRALEILLQLMNDPAAEVRMEAASALSAIGGERALKALKSNALTSDHNHTRKAAGYALAFTFEDEALAPLVHVLNNAAESPTIRGIAAEGIGNIMEDAEAGSFWFKRASKVLRSSLQDESPEVRFWATFALGAMKDKSSLRELFDLAKNDLAVCPEYWSVSKEAIGSIQRILGIED